MSPQTTFSNSSPPLLVGEISPTPGHHSYRKDQHYNRRTAEPDTGLAVIDSTELLVSMM